jgi:transcription antitermination factor NusG
MDNTPGCDRALPWYALSVKMRQEKTVEMLLSSKGYEVFLPLQSSIRRWSDRNVCKEEALFPGYMFCRFDVHRRGPILITPGVFRVAGNGNCAIPVADREIESVRAVVASARYERWPFFQSGQRVSIVGGPLKGVEGSLLTSKGTCRLVVSVALLQCSVAAEVDACWVRPMGGIQQTVTSNSEHRSHVLSCPSSRLGDAIIIQENARRRAVSKGVSEATIMEQLPNSVMPIPFVPPIRPRRSRGDLCR